MNNNINNIYSKILGYLFWIFGFFGVYCFYYGKFVIGMIWFFMLGLLGIGWIVDLFLIFLMDCEVDCCFVVGEINYLVVWLLLIFLGIFGVYCLYIGKWISGIFYFFIGGFFLLGVLYDFWMFNV